MNFPFRQAPIGDDNYLLLASNIDKYDKSGRTGEVDNTVRKTSSSPCWPWVLFPGMKGRSGIGDEALCDKHNCQLSADSTDSVKRWDGVSYA